MFVGLVVLLLVAGLPALDAVVSSDRPTVRPGTQLVVTDRDSAVAGGAEPPATAVVVPPAGWTVEDGSEAGVTRYTSGGLTVDLSLGALSPGSGCTDELREREAGLRALDPSATFGDARSFLTRSGDSGVSASYLGTRGEGLVFVVCREGAQVTLVAFGPIGSLRGAASAGDPVGDMARSIDLR